jgi:hypothetical protein
MLTIDYHFESIDARWIAAAAKNEAFGCPLD